MVYNGPSKGCKACRKRRVKCDQGKPACNNCIKRRVECPGYESTFDYRHRNETNATILRVQAKGEGLRRPDPPTVVIEDTSETSALSPENLALVLGDDALAENDVSGATPLFGTSLGPDPETFVVNWYFTNYPMKSADPQSAHGFWPLLKPLYVSAPSNSPLRPAVAAIASNLLMLFCHQGSDTDLARKFYAKSVSRMKDAVADPVRSKQNDLVLAALSLNFYDNLSVRWNAGSINIENHRRGVVALLKHRGSSNCDNDVNRSVTSSMRTAIVHWAMDRGERLSPEVVEWLTDTSVPVNKACELDIITIKFLDYQHRFKDLYKVVARRDIDQTVLESMIEEGLIIDSSFMQWVKSCPSHWHPLRSPTANLPKSFEAAGVFGDYCLVYWDLSICNAWNTYRLRRLLLLRMVRQLCLNSMGRQYPDVVSTIEVTIQKLVDDQCSTLPFMIGDLMTPVHHSRMYDIHYPTASNGICTYPNPDNDHHQAAASSGGWLASSAIVTVARMAVKDGVLEPFPLRRGQFLWMMGQLDRMRKVFLLSQPRSQQNWKSFHKF